MCSQLQEKIGERKSDEDERIARAVAEQEAKKEVRKLNDETTNLEACYS